MYGLLGDERAVSYRTLIAFVEGIDVGTSRQFMTDFQEWFRNRHSLIGSSSLGWSGEILSYYLPDFVEQNVGVSNLTQTDNDGLVDAAFDELILYASRLMT